MLLFAQEPVQLPARARSLFLIKNVRVRADGHIGSVTYVSSPATYLGGMAALPPRRAAPALRAAEDGPVTTIVRFAR